MKEDPLFRKGSVTSSKFDSYPDKGREREREFVLCVCRACFKTRWWYKQWALNSSITPSNSPVFESIFQQTHSSWWSDRGSHRKENTVAELQPSVLAANTVGWHFRFVFLFFLSMVIDLALSVRLCARARMLTYRNSSCTRPVKRPIRVQHDPDQSNLAYRRH